MINPTKRSEFILKKLSFHGKFTSTVDLHAKLVEALGDLVPRSLTFNVGYFEGQQHSKIVIIDNDDVKNMYERYKGEITLWCERDVPDTGHGKKSKASKVDEERECDVDKIYQELYNKHSVKYNIPKLRLWARCIATKIHDSRDEPPHIPAFGFGTRKPPSQPLPDAIGNAAITIASVLDNGKGNCSSKENARQSDIGVRVDTRKRLLEQLRYLKELYNDGIFNTAEYEDEKKKVCDMLKQL